jgi:thiamine transporter ThiT
MSSATWVGATMIAAAFGCVLSWVPTSFALAAAAAVKFGDVTLSFPAIARITLETGALVGLVWGVAQYIVLRLHAHQAGAWILTNTLAWTASFMSLYFAAFLPDRTTSPAFHIILAAIAGVVLSSFLGLLNGYVLLRIALGFWFPLHTGSEGERRTGWCDQVADWMASLVSQGVPPQRTMKLVAGCIGRASA